MHWLVLATSFKQASASQKATLRVVFLCLITLIKPQVLFLGDSVDPVTEVFFRFTIQP